MTALNVDGLTFVFPESWSACKYDDWSFYRNQFTRIGGVKAVDLIALGQDTAWMIEVKDYRIHPRAKAVDIHQEFADKVVHTLAALLPAKIRANNVWEGDFAARTLQSSSLRLVLHLEQPVKHSKLFPVTFRKDVADRRLFRPLAETVTPPRLSCHLAVH